MREEHLELLVPFMTSYRADFITDGLFLQLTGRIETQIVVEITESCDLCTMWDLFYVCTTACLHQE